MEASNPASRNLANCSNQKFLSVPRSGNVFQQPLGDDGKAEAREIEVQHAEICCKLAQVDIRVTASDLKHKALIDTATTWLLKSGAGDIPHFCTRLSLGRAPQPRLEAVEVSWSLLFVSDSRRGRLFTTEEPPPLEPPTTVPVTPLPATQTNRIESRKRRESNSFRPAYRYSTMPPEPPKPKLAVATCAARSCSSVRLPSII